MKGLNTGGNISISMNIWKETHVLDVFFLNLKIEGAPSEIKLKHLEDGIISPMEVVLKSKKQVVELKQRS